MLSPDTRLAIQQGAIYVRLGNALATIDPGSVSCGWYVRIWKQIVDTACPRCSVVNSISCAQRFDGRMACRTVGCTWVSQEPVEKQWLVEHGQAPGAAAAAAAVIAVCGSIPLGFLGIEEPGFIAKGNQWKLAWAAGEIYGRLADRLVDDRCVWFSKEAQWRGAVFHFGKGLDKAHGETANGRIHEWAEHRCGHPLVDGSGTPELDRANAYAMGETTFELMNKEAMS